MTMLRLCDLGRTWMALALVLLGLANVLSHYIDPRVAAFTVEVTDTKELSVKTSHAPTHGTCTFSYATTNKPIVATEKPTEKETTVTVDFDHVLEKLAGTCLQRKADYWDYEVCFGIRVRQFHGPDSYDLGTKAERSGTTQIFRNGGACEATAERTPRYTVVNFGCNPNNHIASIRESQTCVYAITVGTPLVCSDPNFPVLETGKSPIESSVDPGPEDWFLELVQLSDGRLMCSAYSLELRAAGSKLYFTRFALTIESSANVHSVNATDHYTCRLPGRVKCEPDEVDYTPGAALRSADGFRGKLAFVKVYA